jgi:hypothetical protein
MHPTIPFQSRASDLLAPPFAGALGTTDLRNRWSCSEELLAGGSPLLLTLYPGRRPTLSLASVPNLFSVACWHSKQRAAQGKAAKRLGEIAF